MGLKDLLGFRKQEPEIKLAQNENSRKDYYQKSQRAPSNKIYWKAKSILTENEAVMYKLLVENLAKEHIVLCKVRMEDVIHVDFNLKNRDFANYQRCRGRMKNRHFDFVICDYETQEIQRVIELDGWTHEKRSEREADEMKDAICAEAGVRLVRVKYSELNYPEKVLLKIVSGSSKI